jgi:hypothetical protein
MSALQASCREESRISASQSLPIICDDRRGVGGPFSRRTVRHFLDFAGRYKNRGVLSGDAATERTTEWWCATHEYNQYGYERVRTKHHCGWGTGAPSAPRRPSRRTVQHVGSHLAHLGCRREDPARHPHRPVHVLASGRTKGLGRRRVPGPPRLANHARRVTGP